MPHFPPSNDKQSPYLFPPFAVDAFCVVVNFVLLRTIRPVFFALLKKKKRKKETRWMPIVIERDRERAFVGYHRSPP